MDTSRLRTIVMIALVAIASGVIGVLIADQIRGPTHPPPTPAPTAAVTPTPGSTALPGPESGPQGQFVWAADLESGDLSSWEADGCGGEFNTGNGEARVTDAVAHSGRYSVELTVATDNGADNATRLMRWCEPSQHDAAYFSAWYYFPQQVDVSAGWWNIFQFKSRSETSNDPWWILNVGNRQDGTMYVYLRDWIHEKSYEQNVKDLPVGQWVHFEVFMRRAQDPTGEIMVWQDGTLLFHITNVQTNYDSGRVSWGVNSYSSGLNPSPTVIYIDDVVMSTTPVGNGQSAGN